MRSVSTPQNRSWSRQADATSRVVPRMVPCAGQLPHGSGGKQEDSGQTAARDERRRPVPGSYCVGVLRLDKCRAVIVDTGPAALLLHEPAIFPEVSMHGFMF